MKVEATDMFKDIEEKLEALEKKEVKGNRFTRHLKKHKSAYITAAGAGAALIGMKIKTDRKLATVAYSCYRLGMRDEAQLSWNRILNHVKDGVLTMELTGETDDEIMKHNMELLKTLVSEED